MPPCLRRLPACAALLCALAAFPTSALAAPKRNPDVKRLSYRIGPLKVEPGANLIKLRPITARQKPAEDGWIVRIRPDLKYADGSVPPVDVVHLHHGVWLNWSQENLTTGGPELFFAAGEEKTIFRFPKGYGYRYRADDRWMLNDMLHNLTSRPMTVYVTYELDFVPARTKTAKRITPVRPVWMDVERGSAYPVFDVHRGTGRNGRFTYPTHAKDPYAGKPPKNEWTLPVDGTLISAGGHVHPGGLWNDVYLRRKGKLARLFRSRAKYFNKKAGPTNWDMAMTVTRPNWRVRVRKGDTLKITSTYENRLASWYESMGIMVMYMVERSRKGADPFRTKVDREGVLTHGHLPETENLGGTMPVLPDPRTLPDGPPLSEVDVKSFVYQQGDLSLSGAALLPPIVRTGQSLRFRNLDADRSLDIFHSITTCKAPCNRDTGLAYPLADGTPDLDSGELGFGPVGFTAAKNEDTWETPKDLRPGTYTYFCRIHPFMRGAFRVKDG